MKKSLSLLLAFMLLISSPMIAFAANNDDDDEDVFLPIITRFEIDQSENYIGGNIIIAAYTEERDNSAYWIDTVFKNLESGKSLPVRLQRNGVEDTGYDFSATLKVTTEIPKGEYKLIRAVISDDDGNREVYTQHNTGKSDEHSLPNSPGFKIGHGYRSVRLRSCSVAQNSDGKYSIVAQATGGNGGVDSVTLLFENSENSHRTVVTLGEDEKLSPEIFQGELSLTPYEPDGKFELKTVIIKDFSEEKYTFSNDEEEEDHLPLNVSYSFGTKAVAVDNTKPWFKNIKINSQNISRNEEDWEVNLTAIAGDNLSGIHHVSAKFHNAKSGENSSVVFFPEHKVANHKYSATLRLDIEDKKGSWQLERITVVDNAGNRQIYTTPEELKDEQLLLPNSLSFVV